MQLIEVGQAYVVTRYLGGLQSAQVVDRVFADLDSARAYCATKLDREVSEHDLVTSSDSQPAKLFKAAAFCFSPQFEEALSIRTVDAALSGEPPSPSNLPAPGSQ